MASNLHASLTPNVANAGESLELVFDSSASDAKNGDPVVVTIFEVDDASPFEPQPGKGKLMVTFTGKLVDNTFTLTAPSGGGANPVVPSIPGAPIVKIKAGGKVTDVPLPDKDHEQGVFELRLQVEIKKPKPQKFTSTATTLVRSFDHFVVNKTKRPVVTFITGGRDGTYFTAATEFWKLNADAVIAKDGMSYQEILQMLDKEHDKFGDWGQINIVAHGRERVIQIKLFTDSPTGLHKDVIGEEIARHTTSLPSPGGLDASTQIVMRACNAGQDSALIGELHKQVFGGKGTLFVPKFVQVYQFFKPGGGGPTTANEWFEEALTFDTPSTTAPTGQALQAGLEKAWDALSSPGKGGKKSDEIASFTANHDWVQTLPYTIQAEREADITKTNGTPMTDADIVAKLRSEWETRHKLHEKSVSWNTRADRWVIGVKSKSPTAKKGVVVGFFMRVTKGTGTPMFQSFDGGSTSVGGKTATNVWVVTAKGVEDLHFHIDLGPKPGQAKVTDADSGTPTFVSGTKLEGGKGQMFKLPVTIVFGSAEIELRDARPPVDLVFDIQRHHVDRRRELRKFDAAKAHRDRATVVPKVGDKDHYGSS
jgi:hypothetical protein